MNKIAYYTLKKAIKYLNSITKKRSNMIYLCSGMLYKDNIPPILDEMLKEGLQNKYLIICDGPASFNYAYKNVIHVKHSTVKSIWYYIHSKYVFYDIGIYGQDKPINSQISINVWHGTSLKKSDIILKVQLVLIIHLKQHTLLHIRTCLEK
jgi:hypothetical protein